MSRGARPKLPPAERGLGPEYRRRRAQLLPPNGEPCPYCWLPMWPDQALDADHVAPRAAGGSDSPLRWAHRACNRRDGVRLREAMRERRREPVRSRDW